MKVALSVAGSDSGAGAGIQADLKTFSALGVYGCTAITAITAQNTRKVASITEVPPQMVGEQIKSVLTDIPPDAIKVGMVYSREIIESVCISLSHSKIPIILDPILAAGSGERLLLEDAFDSFVSKLIPMCMLITPNLMEAEKISGIKIESDKDALRAAQRMIKMGAANAIIKGGHFARSKDVTDILVRSDGQVVRFTNPRINVKETHGSGCNFSSAVTAFVARNFDLADACRLANEYVHQAITKGFRLGKGLQVTNPISDMYRDAAKYKVLHELQGATLELEQIDGFGELIPETQSNFVFAIPDAKDISDVAGIRGRIARVDSHGHAVSSIAFGSSRHVASAVLAYMKVNGSFRSALNIRLSDRTLKICKSLFTASSYDRSKEPEEIKKKEGLTMGWGIALALEKNQNADIVYHRGDIGKEPMIIIFGRNPGEVVSKVKAILKNY